MERMIFKKQWMRVLWLLPLLCLAFLENAQAQKHKRDGSHCALKKKTSLFINDT